MKSDNQLELQHDHSFGQDKKRSGENRTVIVILLTAAMMGIEIAAGLAYGSMALLADGLHMASHAAALSISAFAYYFARKRAHDPSFSFGTGKVNFLGGYTGAILLLIFALLMVFESINRLIDPVEISFNQAIGVAILGLIVNGVSVFILGHEEHHYHGHHHEHSVEGHQHHHHDHNLRAAYLHVLADALTSLLAIVALLAAKYYGWIWMDPLMGIVGAVLITKWSFGLLKQSGAVLLDQQGPASLIERVNSRIESLPCQHHEHGCTLCKAEIIDCHVWSIGPNIYSAAITLITAKENNVTLFKGELENFTEIVHSTVEVHQWRS